MSRVRAEAWRFGGALALGVVLATMIAATAAYAVGYRPVVITTGSMGDTAAPGSLVIARPVPADAVAVGDVVVMQRSGNARVTHRVTAIDRIDGQRLATTKGDANPAPDPGTYRLDGTELVAAHIIPKAGSLMATLGSPLAMATTLTLIVGTAVVVSLRTIWRTGAGTAHAAPVRRTAPESP